MKSNAQQNDFQIWNNVKQIRGVVQIICHIGCDVNQYNRFAKFLNKNGYVVWANKTKLEQQTTVANIINTEIKTTEYLRKKYKKPVFLFGDGFGSVITQQIIAKSRLCTAGVCMSGGVRYPKIWVWLWSKFVWLEKRMRGNGANVRIPDVLSSGANQNDCITYELYYSILKSLLKTNYNVCCGTPLLIIGGGGDIKTLNGRLAKSLYNAYKEQDLQNLTLIIYPDTKHQVLFEQDWAQAQQDILDFLNDVNTSTL